MGLVKDIFMAIEAPMEKQFRQDLFGIVQLWKLLPTASSGQITDNMDHLVREYHNQLSDTSGSDLGVTKKVQLFTKWKLVKKQASKHLKRTRENVGTVGAIYTEIALLLTALEACAQIDGLNGNGPGTIFVGDPIKQLNMSYWYNPATHNRLDESVAFWKSEISKETLILQDSGLNFRVKRVERDPFPSGSNLTSPLFPVTDLKTAIQAIVEIVYQGEGGSPCSPFKSTRTGGALSFQTSHYVRFMEMVHGRKLLQMKRPSLDSEISCLNLTSYECPTDLKSDEAFCFMGEEIPFYEDGVWPIITNPDKTMYLHGTDAHRYNHQFN
uniref:Iminophenyl-pyruvate dimer synthase domain-containing protein n=1 Tax=Ciona savignyi TaxID=51511 RepID=H2Y850_CIOSA